MKYATSEVETKEGSGRLDRRLDSRLDGRLDSRKT